MILNDYKTVNSQ